MKRFKRILVYAGTENPEVAVTRAAQLALENEASLTLMDVVKPIPRAFSTMSDVAKPEELEPWVVADRRRRLLEVAGEISDTGLRLDVVVAVGDPATEVTRQVVKQEHDLVIKTADGFSTAGRLFGSVAKSLLRLCPCPVMLLKPEIHGKFDRVLAAIDVESDDINHMELNGKILEFAHSIARRDNAELHVIAAWQLWMEDSVRSHSGDLAVELIRKEHERKSHRAVDALLQVHFTNTNEVKVHLKHGSPASTIRSLADEIEADLLVMGTVCQTGTAGFLIGSTAETIIPDITCSMLALKPDGFASPIQIANRVMIVEDEPLSLL